MKSLFEHTNRRSLFKRTNGRYTCLRAVDLFSECSKSELRRIGSLTTRVDVERGRVLTREGRIGLEFFVVVDGTAVALRGDHGVAWFGPGSFFGELALFDCGVRTATVVAETDMSLLVSSKAEFASLQAAVPRIAHKMSTEVSRRLRTVGLHRDFDSVDAARQPLIQLRPTG